MDESPSLSLSQFREIQSERRTGYGSERRGVRASRPGVSTTNGLCYDIYISKDFSGVPTKQDYTRQKCLFSSFHKWHFRPLFYDFLSILTKMNSRTRNLLAIGIFDMKLFEHVP